MKRTAKMIRYTLATLLCLLLLTTVAFVQGGAWETKAPMPFASNGPGSGVIDGKLFVVAGGATGVGVAALQEYDPTTDMWSLLTPLPTTRPGAAVGAIGDKLYVAGGCPPNGGCGGGETNLLEAYDSVSNTWSTLTPMPTHRSAVTAGVIDGKLYVAGGIGPNVPFQSLNTLEVYDPTIDSWITKAPLLIATQNASAAVITGKLYVVGGVQGNTVLDELEVYDPVTDTWETKAPMSTPRSFPAVGAINGQLHVVGGGSTDPTHEVYDPASNTWTTAAPMPTARQGPTGAVINGKFYVAGGNTNSVALTVLEVYTPPTAQPACVPPPPNMISWWPGENNTNDIIGGNNGTWMGNPGFASGKVASAFDFGGSSYITMGTPPSLDITGNQVTIDGWINPSVNNNAIYFGKTANSFNDYVLAFGFNGIIGIIKAGGTESVFETLFVPPVNQWTHIALTYDGASMRFYANGTMIGSLAKTGDIDGDPSEFAIGGRALDFSGTHLFFAGEFDEVEVFNRALSDSEIAAIFNAGSAGKCQQATNQTPVAKCKSVTVPAGASCMANVSIDDGSFDPDAGDTISVQQSPHGPYPLGSTSVTLTVTDNHGASSQCTAMVTVVDTTPPTIICPPNITIDGNIPNSCSADVNPGVATGTDSCSVVAVVGTRSDGQALSDTYPQGTTTITWTATDGSGNQASCVQLVTVTNPNPIATITGPPSGAIFAVGTPVNFAGTFADNAGGTHSATWMFDSIAQPGTVSESTGAISATHAFSAAGVYMVTLTVSDGCGGAGTATTVDGLTAMVVVYDPNGGFVTGGGWINSLAGAYSANPSLAGRANFGFVSKYRAGATVPTGQTEFQFSVANFSFHGTSYDWLVVAGARAQYKGSGTVNGAGDYGFMLTAIDGQISGGGGLDKFRIKIWDKNNGDAIVYDNQMGADDGADPSTALGGGSIVIHR